MKPEMNEFVSEIEPLFGGRLVYNQAHTLRPFVIFSQNFCDFSCVGVKEKAAPYPVLLIKSL